ncbi:MAG TPA: hypothetical protein VFK18_00695 [Luteimonas sp.]|nr:hypothetical protein [Luteimonas sp.]
MGYGIARRGKRGREAVVLLGFLAAAAGFVLDRTWTSLAPWPRLFDLSLVVVFALVLAIALRAWRGWAPATTVLACALASLVVFAGPLPVLAAALLALAALGLGTWLVPGALALPVGLALVAGLVGWLLPLPVHRPWVHGAVLLPLVILRREAIGTTLRGFAGHWGEAVAEAPAAATLALLALLAAAVGCWLPTLQYDDLAYHLGLPYQLQLSGRYALDPDHQVWALAPWAGDVLHAVAQLVAGSEARGPVNALWLGLAATALHQLVRAAGARAWAQWAAVAVFATVPLTRALAAGMQTELAGAAVLLAFAWLAWTGAGRGLRGAAAGGLLLGLLFGLKLMHAATALPLLAWAVWRHRHALGWKTLAVALPGVAAVGGSSYAYAWWVAGNPVLPLQNATFRSPYFAPVDFLDETWSAGLAADLPWRLTFDTATAFEGGDGALGFLWIALAGAWLLALLQARTRGLALAAGAGLLLALLPMQYARYVYPSLLLCLVPALVALDRVLPQRLGAALLLALCVSQFAFVGSGTWMIRDNVLRAAVLARGADAPLYPAYAPERELLARIRAADAPPAGRVLAIGTDAVAELGGRGRMTSWYSYRVSTRAAEADGDRSGARWEALMRDEQVSDIVLRPDALTTAQRAALARLQAERVAVVGAAEWWRIP